jgi:sodium/proline symporter
VTFSILAAFVVYFLALLAIGLVTYRKSRTATDFIVGGRSLNLYVTALSAHASDMSNWLFMAYPAVVMAVGGEGAWIAIGLVVGMWANWQFVAPKLREETERTGSLTLAAYFSRRFGDEKGVLRTVGALLSLLFFAVYVAAGLVGIGYVVESVLGFDRVLGMGVGLAVVVIYTYVGGYYSIGWVDLWQALFLMAMIVLVPIMAYLKTGPIGPTLEGLGISASLYPQGGWKTLMQIIFLSFGWGLGYFGQIHILSKFMGIKHPEELRKSKWIGIGWQVICLGAATAVGLVGIAWFNGGLENTELVFVQMVKGLFHPFFGTLILCGVLAATISTMDSQLLVLVSILVEDIYHRFIRKHATEKQALNASRISLVGVALVAFAIAAFSKATLMDTVKYSWSGLGSTFGPVLLMALHSKRVNYAGALTGMIFGGVVALVWPLLPTDVPALIPGFVLNLGIIYIVSSR